MILMDFSLFRCLCGDSGLRVSDRAQFGCRASPWQDGRGGCPCVICDGPEAQGIHHRDRPCPHGENVAENSADAGGRALKRFDERWMIVRFDLEGAGPAVANVDDARVLARSLQY
jgi:hypothetical protein